jgi:hypothetical protein
MVGKFQSGRHDLLCGKYYGGHELRLDNRHFLGICRSFVREHLLVPRESEEYGTNGNGLHKYGKPIYAWLWRRPYIPAGCSWRGRGKFFRFFFR